MTRAAQKVAERSSLLHFLERWSEGADWQLVEETMNTEDPDFLLQRVDGLEIVGIELRRASFEPLAQAHAIAEAIADELQEELRAIHVDRLGVLLLFHGASALASATVESAERRSIASRGSFPNASGSRGPRRSNTRNSARRRSTPSIAS